MEGTPTKPGRPIRSIPQDAGSLYLFTILFYEGRFPLPRHHPSLGLLLDGFFPAIPTFRFGVATASLRSRRGSSLAI